jgi:hypothetical protein
MPPTETVPAPPTPLRGHSYPGPLSLPPTPNKASPSPKTIPRHQPRSQISKIFLTPSFQTT